MSIYDVDYSLASQRLLPPDKRGPNMLAWVKALLSPFQWAVSLWFGQYRTGSTAQAWISQPYAKYQRVIYNTIVYESLINNNTDIPTVTTSWQVVQPNFIGLSERILYNGQTLTLTWALNKRFGTTFRQPPNISDIYIGNNTLGVFPFVIGATEQESSDVYGNTSSEFVINSYSFTGRYNFSIYMPVAVYNAIDPLDANRISIINAFVLKYLPAGITFNTIPY